MVLQHFPLITNSRPRRARGRAEIPKIAVDNRPTGDVGLRTRRSAASAGPEWGEVAVAKSIFTPPLGRTTWATSARTSARLSRGRRALARREGGDREPGRNRRGGTLWRYSEGRGKWEYGNRGIEGRERGTGNGQSRLSRRLQAGIPAQRPRGGPPRSRCCTNAKRHGRSNK